ncbi:family 16 glycosylhydrolase [Nocardioides sp. GBK3QG-3]|uniref:Family 16 glycosylhydrolase n=2 Tax=Nocardioides mangrovi TaxID=2874580 RepID=A0ABS7UAY7_9ACTN|nr:family 16 glycosylhydrolase [Nocardioides mangrovi]
MLELESRGNRTVTATENVTGHRTGRWEIRLRSRSFEGRHTDFRVLTQLVPGRGRDQHCGGQNVALESYRPGAHSVQHYVRDTPDREFRTQRAIGLRDDQWHTFAVEVTKQRISWFVDAQVVSSERRSAALSGASFALRFTLQAEPGATMNRTRMQMDWARYWTLERPNQRSTKAPQLDEGTYGGAC